MHQKQRGLGGSDRSGTEPGSNRSTPADGSGKAISPSAPPAQLADLRFQRDVERLHSLGPRPLGELLAELGREHLIRSEIETKLAQFAQLDPAIVKELGADRFPPRPLHLVRP